jgi:diguanylate cyclase (GGDEF)-like protein
MMTQAGQGSLMILNEDTLELEVKATLGIHRSVLEHLRVKPGEGISGMVLKTGDPWVVGNVEEDPRVMKPNRARYRGKSFLSFPLKAGAKAIGVLNLSDREGGRLFSEEDIPALEALTLFAAVAVERFRYYQSSMDLRRISITDVLSGLLNRRYFEERLAEEIERSKRYGEPFSLIILDIDDFKRFNDSYGHLIGDEGLRNTASGIRRCIRAIDIAARYGGEEFAVILPQTEKEEARSIGDRIREEIELGGIEIPGEDQKARLTVSIGIACYPTDATYHDELIRHADRALYHAKAQGKNRVVL